MEHRYFMIHPETGEVLETQKQYMAALAEIEERMAPLYRVRRQIRDAATEKFETADMPKQRRYRTETQEKVARCPRCGTRLALEEEKEGSHA